MKTILLSILVIGVSFIASAQTSIPAGSVYGTWTLAGSPYNVNGNINIPTDSTLIIQPGVSVVFTGLYRFDVRGRMISVGTITDTIIFTATGFWRGIRFNGTSSTQDSSLFIYCKVQKSKYSYCSSCASDYLKGGAFMIDGFSKIRISNCRITQNNSYSGGGGIYCKNSAPIISNSTITNNDVVNGNGGGIYCSGASLDITNNFIANNIVYAGHYGGGIYCDTSSSNITGNTISGNTATKGGGIYCSVGNPNVDNNSITNNSVSNGLGGGIYCAANATITNNIIINNHGGIYCDGSAPLISNNTISTNTSNAGNGGGGIYADYSSATITNNTITSNSLSSGNGAGIKSAFSSLTISNNIISNNKLLNNGHGGGIFSYKGTSLISNNTITDNSVPDFGGGIYCTIYDSSSIIDNTISNNLASNGGGIFCSFSSNLISGNLISNDSALTGEGGGIFCGNENSPTISSNTINNNYAAYKGGAIFCDAYSSSTITNNFISNNSAAVGGGIYCYNDTSTIVGDVIVNNTAFSTGNWDGGGGVYFEYSFSTIYNCTIANNNSLAINSAGGGGGLYCLGNTIYYPVISNTIFWGNFTANGNGNNISLVNNFTNFTNCDIEGGGFPGNNINILPIFVSPSAGAGVNFNGLSADWTLQAGSPCINTGDTTGLSLPFLDAAGNSRIVNQVDMGAYEWQLFMGLSQDQNYTSGIHIYPNPFSTSTTFSTTNSFNNAMLTLQNSLGQTVKQIENISGNSVILYRDNLPSGLYYIRLTEENKTYTSILVIADK